jgi:hypothetical protein
MDHPTEQRASTLDLMPDNHYWGYFCECFEITPSEVDYQDRVAVIIYDRVVNSFFSRSSAWSADLDNGNVNASSLIKAFKSTISRNGLDNQFNLFLTRYADDDDIEIGFDVEPEYRYVQIENHVKRRVVLLRRKLIPLEIHDYEKYSAPLMVFMLIAEKLIEDEEDLTADEINNFAAGLTHFKDYIISVDSGHFMLGENPVDIKKAIGLFGQKYLEDTRIHDELSEVEFFLERLNIPQKYFTEIVDFFCKIEEFYRGEFRKSEEAKRSPGELAPTFTHPLHVFRLSFGGVEASQGYSNLIPTVAEPFWKDLAEPEALLSMSFRAAAHDLPEEVDKLEVHALIEKLQNFYVRAASRLYTANQRAEWVEEENDALQRLNAKREFESNTKGERSYGLYILELLRLGDNVDIYLKMCDNLHNMTTAIPSNYDQGEPKAKFIEKIQDSEPLIEKALEVGFYWFMPMNSLSKVFSANGKALLAHSHAWRTIYTEIYLPRGGNQLVSPEA